jgi:FkbM family methyltransferase
MKTFIELGACDFDNLTSLLYSGWRGFFIEPIPYYMDSLKSMLEKQKIFENVFYEQCAISDFNGEIEMVYVVDPDEEWKRGISHVKANSLKNYTSDLINYNDFSNDTIKVPSMTLNSFIEKHSIDEIDLFKIDIEGHELIVLENYDWSVKPKVLKIEHKFVDFDRLNNLLFEKGYYCWREQDDLYAILK